MKFFKDKVINIRFLNPLLYCMFFEDNFLLGKKSVCLQLVCACMYACKIPICKCVNHIVLTFVSDIDHVLIISLAVL